MDRSFAATLRTLRGSLLKRLVEVRNAIDVSHMEISEQAAESLYGEMLDKMARYWDTGDDDWYRDYLDRWMAIRASEGMTPESLIHLMVAASDVIVQVARMELPSAESAPFVRAVVNQCLDNAKAVVESLVDELDELSDRHTTLRASESTQ